MKYTYFLILILFISCRSDIELNNISGEVLKFKEIKEDNIVILGQGFCVDCMRNIISYLIENKKSYIVVYPTESFNNLTKISMNTFLINQKVDSTKIYWVDKEIYFSYFKNLPSPFVIDNKNNNIIKYSEIFNKDGTVKKTFKN